MLAWSAASQSFNLVWLNASNLHSSESLLWLRPTSSDSYWKIGCASRPTPTKGRSCQWAFVPMTIMIVETTVKMGPVHRRLQGLVKSGPEKRVWDEGLWYVASLALHQIGDCTKPRDLLGCKLGAVTKPLAVTATECSAELKRWDLIRLSVWLNLELIYSLNDS